MAEKQRPRQKHSAKAFDEGRAAREARTPRDECPYHPDQRPQTRAWQDGWDSIGPLTNVHIAAPAGVQVRVSASVATVSQHFVPDSEDITRYLVWRAAPQNYVPCAKCRRWRLDSGSPACISNGTRYKGAPVVEVYCRACGATTKIPVKG